MAIRKERLAHEVVGVSRQHASLVHALKSRAIDRASHDVKKSVENADLIILSTPVQAIIDILPTISKLLKRGALVIDVGSTKAAIVEMAEKNIPPHAFFVGCHPLAGSEKTGALNGSAELFRNALCLITPTDKTNKPAVERAKVLWTKLGAHIKILSPAEHDKILSYMSHLPHLAAYGLMQIIPSEYLECSGQGLKDMTRIASSDPQMWADICMVNAKNVLQSVDELVKTFAAFRKAIILKDTPGLAEHFKKSKQKRDSLEKKENA